MTKVLGTKVNDSLYDEFAALPGSISTNLRKAVEVYLKYCHNQSLTEVNRLLFDEKYKELTNMVDKHLSRLNKDSEEV